MSTEQVTITPLAIALVVFTGIAILVALIMGVWAFHSTLSLQNQMTNAVDPQIAAFEATLLQQAQGMALAIANFQAVSNIMNAQAQVQVPQLLSTTTSAIEKEIVMLKENEGSRLDALQQALSLQTQKEAEDAQAIQAWLLLLSGVDGSVQPLSPNYGFVRFIGPTTDSCARYCNNLSDGFVFATPSGPSRPIPPSAFFQNWAGITSIPNTHPINGTCLCYEDANYPRGTITTNI